jgi:hypothetical protein
LAFIVFQFCYDPLHFLDALEQVKQLDGLRGVVEDAQRGPDFIARLPTSQVAVQGLDGLARGLLQPADSSLHNPAPGLTVGGLKIGESQPTVQGRFAHAGLSRSAGVRGLGQQRCYHSILPVVQLRSVASHLLSPAIVVAQLEAYLVLADCILHDPRQRQARFLSCPSLRFARLSA